MGTRGRVVEELVRGRDLTARLQVLLEAGSGDRGSVAEEQIVEKILRSFNLSISMLRTRGAGEVCQIPAATQMGSPLSGDGRSSDSGERSNRPAAKDRRGCYKRRKTSDSWVRISSTTEDGHAWRKYGQKEILNAKFPRCYFRCTHKNDQGCKALKQVQRVQEDPTKYRITYFGQHTCKSTLLINHIQNYMDPDPVESYLLNFDQSQNSTEQNHHHSLPFAPPIKEETQSNLSGPASSARPEWSGGGAGKMPPQKRGSDPEDVISSVYSSASTNTADAGDFGFLIEPVGFESDFHFEQFEFI